MLLLLPGARGECVCVGVRAPRIPEYTQQSFNDSNVPLCFAFECCGKSPPLAHDVFSSPRVETKPAAVHPIHGELL